MPKQCGKCYELGHVKSDCNNESKTWGQFVNELVEQGIPLDHVGTWVERPITRGRARGIVRGQRGQRGGQGRGGYAQRSRGRGIIRGGQRGAHRGGRGRGRGQRGAY